MDGVTIRQLQGLRLFAGIEEGDIPNMLRCIGGQERRFAKGEYIFMEGDSLRLVGVLLSGGVQMIKEDVWGDRVILTTMRVGALFGESFVCQETSLSTVSFLASADCRVLFLPFRRLMTTCGMACQFHQRLIENMVVLLAEKNVELMDKMEILSQKTIREKILVWLSQQAQRSGSRKIQSALGRVELAEYLCVDRSALTRELGNMKRENLIDYEKNTYELKAVLADTDGEGSR